MAISATNLATSSDNVDRNSYTTGSISPSTNQLVICWVGNQIGSGTATTPTVTGAGLTWVQINTSAAANTRMTAFRALGTPSAGALTIDFGGVTQIGCGWSIIEYDGAQTSGSNGANAIKQSATGANASATTLTVTLGAVVSGNAVAGGFVHKASESTTHGTGFTTTGDNNNSGPAIDYFSEFNATAQTTVDASWSTTSAVLAVAVEIAAPKTKTHSIDLISLLTSTKTETIDTIIKKTQTKTQGIDVKVIKAVLHGIDVLTTGGSLHYNISAIMKATKTKIYNIDVKLIRNSRKLPHNISAKIKKTQTKTQAIDVNIRPRNGQTHNIASVIKKTQKITHAISVILNGAVSPKVAQGIDVQVVKFIRGQFGCAVSLGGICLSDHMRDPIGIAWKNIELKNITAGQNTTRVVIAQKRTFTLSWKQLPSYDGETVDGYAGRLTLRGLVDQNISMAFHATNYDGSSDDAIVYVSGYNESLVKRWDSFYWDIQLTLQEE